MEIEINSHRLAQKTNEKENWNTTLLKSACSQGSWKGNNFGFFFFLCFSLQSSIISDSIKKNFNKF